MEKIERFFLMRCLELIGQLAVGCNRQDIVAEALEVGKDLAEVPKAEENGG